MKNTLLLLCLAFLPMIMTAQQRSITGTVHIDSVGSPGVNISLKGTTIGTATDVNGHFRLEIPSDSIFIVFSFVGHKTITLPVANRSIFNIYMIPDFTELDEVIVTGYKSETKANIIGAIGSVGAKDFEEIPVASMDQALQGQISGVQVTQSSGTPGGGITVKIRGNTSIAASNRPLFIVDGVPVEDGGLSLRSFGGQNDNALSLINPNDIESIQVLKDASAKAMYGSRAANGVVIVTTKRGKSGKFEVNFDLQRGLIDVVKKVELLDATQLVELQREAVDNAGYKPDVFGLIPGVTDGVNTDWLDEILRTALLQSYQLSMKGGSERTRFYFSNNFRDEEGVQWNNRFIRFTSTLNLDHQASSRFSLGTNLTISRSRNDRVKGDNFLDGVYSGAIKSLPYYSPFDENGYLLAPGSDGYPGFPNFNPLAQAVLPRFESHVTKVIAGFFGKYEILRNLQLNSKFSVDMNSMLEDQYEPSSTAIGGYLPSVGGKGYGVYSTGIINSLIQSNILTYQTEFKGHKLELLGGTEVLYRKIRNSSVQGRMFSSDDFTYISSAGIVDQGSSYMGENGLISFIGEAKYNIKERYLFSISMRADGSSRFGTGNKFGYFPAGSAAWRISSEPFMESFGFIDDLKLRVTTGFTGNENIGNYRYLGTFGARTYNGASGTGPASLRNEDLQWENTRESNAGLDLSMYSGKIQLTLDLYNNVTNQQLLTKLIPYTTGFGGYLGNIGKVRNNGVELKLATVNIDKPDYSWKSEINLSHNSNLVVQMADTLPIFTGYQAAGVTATSVVKTGYPIGTFWGLRFLGVDPATGDAIYDDINGDGRITDDDGTVIGNSQPDFIGGITNVLRYKNFDFNIFFQFSYGSDILNLSNGTLLNAGEDIDNNQSVLALKRWQNPGDITSVPRYEWNNTYNNRHSSRLIEDGSYFRLKSLTLGYNIPELYSRKARLNRARIYVTGVNLLTFSNYSGADPEVSTLDGSVTAAGIDFFTLPQVKTFVIGLKATL